jgi:hypothetical protein
MKIAKPSSRDLDAGMDLLGVLHTIDGRFGGPWPNCDYRDTLKGLGDEEFDCDDVNHLRALYNSLAELLRTAPGFAGRVLFGMCGVICYDKNRFIDPGVKHLDLHPDVRAGLDLLAQQRADFLPRLEREAQAAVASTIEAAAARHLQEMARASAVYRRTTLGIVPRRALQACAHHAVILRNG